MKFKTTAMSFDFMQLLDKYALVRFNVDGEDIFIYKSELMESCDGIFDALYALAKGW